MPRHRADPLGPRYHHHSSSLAPRPCDPTTGGQGASTPPPCDSVRTQPDPSSIPMLPPCASRRVARGPLQSCPALLMRSISAIAMRRHDSRCTAISDTPERHVVRKLPTSSASHRVASLSVEVGLPSESRHRASTGIDCRARKSVAKRDPLSRICIQRVARRANSWRRLNAQANTRVIGRRPLITASESLLAQLRAATSDLHRALDEALGLARGSVTLQSYEAFLRGSLAALEPIEVQLRGFGGSESLSRCALLRADLNSLRSDAGISPVARVPRIDTEAAAFAVRYVIEGSALGGAVLARAFDSALQLKGQSLSYLTLYGARLGEHWREFCNELERFGRTATPSMRAEACASARAVFELYYSAFRSTGAVAVAHE